jgi:hypothetical protein
VGQCRRDTCDSGWGPVSGCYEYDDEMLGSVIDGGSF